MFKPNNRCRIQLSNGFNVHGQPVPGAWITEGCSIVKLVVTNEKSSVRADSSASRGNARELVADAVLLLTVKTRARIDDIIEMRGTQYKISGRHERFDAAGRLDHIEIHAMIWSGK